MQWPQHKHHGQHSYLVLQYYSCFTYRFQSPICTSWMKIHSHPNLKPNTSILPSHQMQADSEAGGPNQSPSACPFSFHTQSRLIKATLDGDNLTVKSSKLSHGASLELQRISVVGRMTIKHQFQLFQINTDHCHLAMWNFRMIARLQAKKKFTYVVICPSPTRRPV